jgi:DNA processing protein
MSRLGRAGRAIDALPGLARRGGRRDSRVCPRDEANREMDAVAALGARLIALGEPGYPPLLAHIEDAPPLITLIGDAALCAAPTVAVVGARNASASGRSFARAIAAELGGGGLMVVSGLARGIDAAAHEGALSTGTVAVVAGGVDVVYPRENGDLYRAIAERGAVVAEMPPGTVPQARHFPRRNRLIAGMARGVVVVEAGIRSGSLITARLALEQGREVFAVPGAPLDPRSRGANRLIREGATLTESAADVFEALGGALGSPAAPPQPPETEAEAAREATDAELSAARRTIEQSLSPTPVSVDELVRQCQFSPSVVSTVLLEIELAGRLERHPGNQVSLVPAD